SFGFFYALDGYDSAGRFDEYLGEYFRDEPDAEAWLAELYRMVDLQGGWHFIHTGRNPEFTRRCLRAQTLRRPNSGLLVGPDTPTEIWDEIFDLWGKGIPSPALYSEAGYRRGLRAYPEIARADRERFVFGGCTELMFEGCSSIGSIEAGINLLEIWNQSTPTRFAADLRLRLEELAAGVKANSEFAARNRPQLIRTLFIDDCIEHNLEYRAGGARCNGGVVNVAGLTDTANAIAAARGIQAKFGNDHPEVDAIARRLAETVFRQIRHHPMRNGGPAFPAVIMFVTYPYHGSYVDGSAGGRPAGAPLADSAGAATGDDRHGPTALLNSVAKLPSQLGIGTLVLNLRIERDLAADPVKRRKLQALLQGFFAQGGLQLQPTLIDRDTLQKAYRNPDAHPELIVRIGGYSEYYQRLSRELQLAVLERTEHLL
ncbi:MAG: glycine radical domain-containing protein, partial [Victivallaceae bacterium]